MGKIKLKAQLALWRRRVTFRRHRHDLWQRRLTAARKRDRHPRQQLVDSRDKWSKLLAQAHAQVTHFERELATRTAAKGVDVSNNNGHVDFARIAGAGFRFVFCKATEGLTFNDAFFHGNVEAARAAGLKVGAYHFLTTSNGVTQARHFAARVKAAGLGKGDLLPVVDVEQAGVTMATVKAFVDETHAQLGVRPLIYTFPSFATWRSTFGCKLWIANFGVTHPTIPKPWKSFAVWQFSSSASVPGVSGRCDVNTTPDMENLIR